jgi:hypothetical protein
MRYFQVISTNVSIAVMERDPNYIINWDNVISEDEYGLIRFLEEEKLLTPFWSQWSLDNKIKCITKILREL